MTEQQHIFPNGFESWQETHFEMVCMVQNSLMLKHSLSCQRHETEGTGGLYELAKEMTDKFENDYAGRVWDGDFFDTLEEFCRACNL